MAITEAAKAYHEKLFPGSHSTMLDTDPEFMERFYNFAYDEVVNQNDLDDRTRFMAILATLLGCQGVDEFHCQMGAALNFGVTPVEVDENMLAIPAMDKGESAFYSHRNPAMVEWFVRMVESVQHSTTALRRKNW